MADLYNRPEKNSVSIVDVQATQGCKWVRIGPGDGNMVRAKRKVFLPGHGTLAIGLTSKSQLKLCFDHDIAPQTDPSIYLSPTVTFACKPSG
ncbi:MAG: hypothetical protein RH862_03555 [Leptospiraceae bacterium]